MRNCLLTVLASLGTTGFVHAAEDNGSSNYCCPRRGEPLDPNCSHAIYPLEAKPDLCWDVFARASFLYWSGTTAEASTILGYDSTGHQIKQSYQDAPYKPGFEVGVGCDLGAVVLDINYLRMHYNNTTHYSASPGGTLKPFQVPTVLALTNFPTYTRASFDFTQNIDDIAFTLQTPCYFSKRVVVTAGYGIDLQFAKNEYTRKFSNPSIAANVGEIKGLSKYWAIGPQVNLDFEGLLCYGFKAIGNLSLAIDYMEFTSLDSDSSFPGAFQTFGTPPSPFANFQQTNAQNYMELCTPVRAEIGLGWQSYLFCDQIYLDLSVTYDWYNRLFPPRVLESVLVLDPYFHGLKVQGRIDF